jgi:hypothetical protein
MSSRRRLDALEAVVPPLVGDGPRVAVPYYRKELEAIRADLASSRRQEPGDLSARVAALVEVLNARSSSGRTA